MIKIILILCGFSHMMYADFMDTVGDIVKSTLSEDEKELPKIKTVGTVGTSTKQKKDKGSLLESVVENVKETIGADNSDTNIIDNITNMIDLEEGEHFGLPSVFGLNKKKAKTVFGSTLLGNSVLGDMKETGSTFYKGFKTTGESTEFMSGVMYKSAKIYNSMFEMFDDSPFNVFEEDEKDPSVFDLFDQGNAMLDMLE